MVSWNQNFKHFQLAKKFHLALPYTRHKLYTHVTNCIALNLHSRGKNTQLLRKSSIFQVQFSFAYYSYKFEVHNSTSEPSLLFYYKSMWLMRSRWLSSKSRSGQCGARKRLKAKLVAIIVFQHKFSHGVNKNIFWI